MVDAVMFPPKWYIYNKTAFKNDRCWWAIFPNSKC